MCCRCRCRRRSPARRGHQCDHLERVAASLGGWCRGHVCVRSPTVEPAMRPGPPDGRLGREGVSRTLRSSSLRDALERPTPRPRVPEADSLVNDLGEGGPDRPGVPCRRPAAIRQGSETSCPPSPWRSSPPLVIAHAGGEGLGPSNTIEAMERSLVAGADILDVDLRMTSDGVIVARHDRDVATTTDGRGNVDELTWDRAASVSMPRRLVRRPVRRSVRVPSLSRS